MSDSEEGGKTEQGDVNHQWWKEGKKESKYPLTLTSLSLDAEVFHYTLSTLFYSLCSLCLLLSFCSQLREGGDVTANTVY